MNKKPKSELRIDKINKVVDLSSKILKIFYTLLIVGVILLITITIKEWHIHTFFLTLLGVLSPLFIGYAIAWLFNPLLKIMVKKGINRILSAIIIYGVVLAFLYIFLITMFPVLYDQINDLIGVIPNVLNDITSFASKIFTGLNNIQGFDISSIKDSLLTSIASYATDFTVNLPNRLIGFLSSLISGLGIFAISLIIGFFLLLDFDNTNKKIFGFIPQKYREEYIGLIGNISSQLYTFIKGTLFVAFVVFVANSVGFAIVGLKAPLLFGLFCGITNIIPYIGPYLGGIPAVLVGLSQGTLTGVLCLIIIIVIQTLESNILTPIIMSKTMKLHPVTIIIALLIFGYLFGIVGMLLATPIIALIKILFKFFSDKYGWFETKELEIE